MRTRMSSSLRGACPAEPPREARSARASSVRSTVIEAKSSPAPLRGAGSKLASTREGVSGAGPWRGAILMDDRFQMIEIASKGGAASGRQPTRRLRTATDELLVDGDDPRTLQLLQVHAQVAVRHLQRIAQLGKRQRWHGSQHRDDRQPSLLVQHRIEFFYKALDGVHDTTIQATVRCRRRADCCLRSAISSVTPSQTCPRPKTSPIVHTAASGPRRKASPDSARTAMPSRRIGAGAYTEVASAPWP